MAAGVIFWAADTSLDMSFFKILVLKVRCKMEPTKFIHRDAVKNPPKLGSYW